MPGKQVEGGEKPQAISTTIEAWLSVRNGAEAIAFYKSAFGAEEIYRLDIPDGSVVARLSIAGSTFWLADGAPDSDQAVKPALGGGTVRLILTVTNPDEIFANAIKAGATEIFPVAEEHGWKLGRVADPFGLHWEIGHPLAEH
jgi:PhnB protein